jgi:tetratricopeptide (TPR) repeat protein
MALGFRRLSPVAWICWLLMFFGVSAEEAISPFAAASSAFGNGDYRTALTLFEAARSAGADGPAVPFNIAVCRYRLGEYAAAEAEFAALAVNFPAMRALAEYNRGLALLELGRARDAEAAFATARAEGDAQLSALAAAQLSELGVAAPARAPASLWDGLLEVGLGHDDNVALVDDIALPAGESADSAFTELIGYASRSLDRGVPLRLDLNGYVVRYADAARFDQESLRAAVAFERSRGAWQFEFGPHYSRSALDGQGFLGELGAGLRSARPLDALGPGWRLGASVMYSDVGAQSSRFAYLEGAKRQVRVAIMQRGARMSFDAILDVEDSDRAAPSVSALRRRLIVGLGQDVGAEWFVAGSVTYRLSSYDRTRDTDEDLTELRLNARRAFGARLRLLADYRRSSNDADLAAFSYDANRIVVSISKSF